MNLRTFIADDDAVSPVIGVILMVAITVILAAVIGTFVLGIGSEQQRAPAAAFDFEQDVGLVTITHLGGDSLTTANSASVLVQAGGGQFDWLSLGDIVAGTTIDVGSSGSELTAWTPAAGDDVRVVWTSNPAARTATIGEFQVP